MIISSIKQSSPGRLTVLFDTGEELKTTLSVVTDLRLYSGRELDETALSEFRLSSSRALARERALALLSRRPMSGKELRDKLICKGEDEDAADYCVEWLTECGFINDESYSAAIAQHYSAKGYGAGRIRAELARRVVSRELWEDALENLPDSSDKLYKFIASRLHDPSDRDQVRKVSQALYRRGYSWEEIRAALNAFRADCNVDCD